MTEARLRVGVVGTGAVGARHISLLEASQAAEIACVCDADEDRARRTADRVGADHCGDVYEMLVQAQPNAIFVCTPPSAHADPAVAALEAGVHVYVEKPLARTLAQGRAIVEAWESSDVVCAVGYQWRALELLDDIRDSLAGQPMGLLVSRNVGPAEHGRVEAIAGRVGDQQPWFMDPTASGGILFELGSHDIDLQIALGGRVKTVQAASGHVALAQSGLCASAIPDALALILHFEEGGGLGVVQVAWTKTGLPEYYSLDILTPNAVICLTLDPEFTLRGTVHDRPLSLQAQTPPLERSVARFIEAAQNRARGDVFCTPQDAYQTLATAVACEQALSNRRGRVTVEQLA